MIADPIVEELDRLRAEQMARFNFDFRSLLSGSQGAGEALIAGSTTSTGGAEPTSAVDAWLSRPPLKGQAFGIQSGGMSSLPGLEGLPSAFPRSDDLG